MRSVARAVVIGFVALGGLLARPSPVAAECSFVPPWPPITGAIPTAREIVVGEVITVLDPDAPPTEDGPRIKALWISAVLRGDRRVGDRIDMQWLLPNWPWDRTSDDTPAYPSCSYLHAGPGEMIAIAFDALQPTQELSSSDDVTWLQPPTRYNAMGVLVSEEIEEPGRQRERVTLSQLQALAAMPVTDTTAAAQGSQPARLWPLVVLAGFLAGLVTLVRPRRLDLGQR